MNSPIEGKTVLNTGANRGIGRSFVEVFLQQGAVKVYAAVRNPESAQPLVQKYGDRVVVVPLDLSDAASIEGAAAKAQDVDVLVNKGGVLKTSTPLDPGALNALPFELDVNLFGLIRVAQSFAPALKANGGGHFVQLNSVASENSFPNSRPIPLPRLRPIRSPRPSGNRSPLKERRF